MNPYLAKLMRNETHHPYEPSKPSKPILPVVGHANTTGGTGFEGFEGDLSRCLSENEAAADRSRPDPFGRLGRTYAALTARSPEHVPADRWQQAVQDGRRFLAKWGAQAAALGWTPRDLFGLQKSPDQSHPSYRCLSRYDETGLIWLLRGRPVVALTVAAHTFGGRGRARINHRVPSSYKRPWRARQCSEYLRARRRRPHRPDG